MHKQLVLIKLALLLVLAVFVETNIYIQPLPSLDQRVVSGITSLPHHFHKLFIVDIPILWIQWGWWLNLCKWNWLVRRLFLPCLYQLRLVLVWCLLHHPFHTLPWLVPVRLLLCTCSCYVCCLGLIILNLFCFINNDFDQLKRQSDGSMYWALLIFYMKKMSGM